MLKTHKGGSGDLYRYPGWATNYYGWVVMQDGDPNTAEADYVSWNLSIDDTNDADHDTIPDFSDDPQAAPARQPKLTLALSPGHVLLSIAWRCGPCASDPTTCRLRFHQLANGAVGHAHQRSANSVFAAPGGKVQLLARLGAVNEVEAWRPS